MHEAAQLGTLQFGIRLHGVPSAGVAGFEASARPIRDQVPWFGATLRVRVRSQGLEPAILTMRSKHTSTRGVRDQHPDFSCCHGLLSSRCRAARNQSVGLLAERPQGWRYLDRVGSARLEATHAIRKARQFGVRMRTELL